MHPARCILALAIACYSGRALAQPASPAEAAAPPDAPDPAPASGSDATEAELAALESSASPAAARIDAARRLGTQGLAAFDARAYLTAIERLTGALRLHDAPTLRLYRARAFGKLGRWVAACEDFDAILRSRAAATEPAVVVPARDAATREGREACVRIAKLRLVEVDRASGALEVRLDGAVWPRQQLDRVRYLDPGPHGLERIDASGASSRALSLPAGETLTVSLRSLEPVEQTSVDAELLRFLAERPHPAPSARDAALPADTRDAAPAARATEAAEPAGAAGKPSSERFRLDASLLGTMYHQVEYSARALSSFEGTSTSLVGRLALEWHPLPERIRDWFGVGATWVQDYGTGDFDYSESVALVMSRYSWGRWRVGAKLGTGFVMAGGQRFAPLEPSLELGGRFGDLFVQAVGTFVAPISDVSHSIYTDISGYGLEGRIALDYQVWRWLGVQLSLASRRFAFDLALPDSSVVLGDGAPAPRASSMVDRYTSGYLGVIVSL
jgi:hypothetical protein